LCKGDRHDVNNLWQWDHVRLNLPGSEDYDPSMPRVMLLRKDGELATREAHYVDDVHPCVRKREGSNEARRACAQLKSRMNSRGNQADDWKCWNSQGRVHTKSTLTKSSTDTEHESSCLCYDS
jgi:hypothetical protein